MAFRVSTLPGVRILAPAGEVTALAGRRLPLALLVYLALERSASRDTLLGLLWPDRDEERARHSLSQAITDLRRALGAGSLQVKGDDVALEPGVESDVALFEQAVAAGRWDAALALYGGAFLEGARLAETHAFEDWTDRRRAQLARLHRKARRERLAELQQAGDVAGALAVAQRWAELEPLEDEAQQQTIELLARLGRRAEALRQYERFREALRHEELEPMPELAALAARVAAGELGPALPRTGGQAVAHPAAAQATSSTPAPVAPPPPVAVPAAEVAPARGPARGRVRGRGLAVLLLGVVLAGSAGWFAWRMRPRQVAGSRRGSPAEAPALRPDQIAVLPFQDLSPGHDKAYLASALTETLIDQLTGVSGLRVVSRAGVRPYADGRAPPDSIGRALKVGTIVTGSVLAERDRVRVTVSVVDAADGTVLETGSVEHPEGEMIPLVDDAVADVTGIIRRRVGQSVQVHDWRAGTGDEEAWGLFQRAHQLMLDSEKLLGAGDAAGALAVLDRADSLLSGAEHRDPHWLAVTVERGSVDRRKALLLLAPGRRNAQAGDAALRRAIGHADLVLARDSTEVAALELRGLARSDEATLTRAPPEVAARLLAAAEQDLWNAVAHDVHRPGAWAALSGILLSKAEWSGASATARRAYEEDAYLDDAEVVLYNGYQSAFELGADTAADRWCAETARRTPAGWGAAVCRLELMAWSGAVRPDVPAAWAVRDRAGFASEDPEVTRLSRNRLDLMVAAVLARAGLADSARNVIARARAAAPGDRSLIQLEARVRVLLHERARALELLGQACAYDPTNVSAFLRGRMFASLGIRQGCASLAAGR